MWFFSGLFCFYKKKKVSELKFFLKKTETVLNRPYQNILKLYFFLFLKISTSKQFKIYQNILIFSHIFLNTD